MKKEIPIQERTPYYELRPWGDFTQFTDNEVSTVKILTMNKESQLSYQYHDHREEYWYVIEGEGYAILNDKKIDLKKGDEVKIAKKDKHRLGSQTGMRVLEISFGHFDENDNHRIEDDYGRDSPKN